MCFLRPHQIW